MENLDSHPYYIEKEYNIKVAKGQTPERLDVYLTSLIFNATRARVQKAIEAGKVLVNGKLGKNSRKVQPNDNILCILLKAPPIELLPQNIPLDIAYEDNVCIVVNKPAGMVTHPGFGNRYGTLVNAILYHYGMRNPISIESDIDEPDEDLDSEIDESEAEGEIFAKDEIRPGIVHRLDKDTSGLLVLAKNPEAHTFLARQFANRTTEREYNAIVWGNLKEDEGVIEGDIGRSPRDRKLFAIVKKGGKYAKTEYKVIERFEFATLIKLKLHTGRTHQIRVHLASIHHPVFGDKAYGGDAILYSGQMPQLRKKAAECIAIAQRQLLHARTLGFKHPVSKEFLSFSSELPEDFKQIIEKLRLNK